MWNDLTEMQKTAFIVINDEREVSAIDQGVARYHRKLESQSVTGVETDIITRALSSVAAWIKKDQDAIKKGRAQRGRPVSWGVAYITMNPEKLAFITMRYLLETPNSKVTAVAREIAHHVCLEHQLEEVQRLNRLRTAEEKGFKTNILSKLDNVKKVRGLYKAMTGVPLNWTPTESIGLGARLITAVVESTGLWACRKDWEQKHVSVMYIEQTDELTQYIVDRHGNVEVLSPLYVPMSCPPLDWDLDGAGGYRIIQRPMIREKNNQRRLDGGAETLTPVLKSLNHIQSVEWMIDTQTVELARHIQGRNHADYDNAFASTTLKPIYPPYADNATKDERKVWFHHRDAAVLKHASSVSKRMSQMIALHHAGLYIGIPVFFPHSLDWRGRIYPICTMLSPQGGDLQKALLRFARKKPLGKTGFRALKIWAAGCAGVDKVSFDARIRWFDETYPLVIDFDPYDDQRWVDYDNPFLFVQAAREIQDALRSGNTSTFMSNVSACVDGSQNGIQHLSALGLDAVGGEAVNLIDQDEPADLYADVAALVAASVEADCEMATLSGNLKDDVGQDVPCVAWLDIMRSLKKRRATVKRPVLAYPYGVTMPGMAAGLRDDGLTDGLQGSSYKNAWYLSEHIDASVRDVVISAGRLMDWFRGMAREISKIKRPITWLAPSGMPVKMHYLVMDERQVRTCLARLTIRFPINYEDVDTEAQVRGIVANFIHSLDASHIVGTCLACVEEGIVDLHFIHDSYGTHACDIEQLGCILRSEFVKMHKTKPLQRFVQDLGFPTDPLPPEGNLDLDSVLKSKYFFA